MKQFQKGTNIGPKATHALTDLGNMLLFPKLAKRREFDPCKSWAAVIPESLLKKIRQVGEAQATHKQRIFGNKQGIFGNDGLNNFWDFVGLNFSLVKILWPDPLHNFLFVVLVTAMAVVTMLQITPHHSYYCCGITLWQVSLNRITVVCLFTLVLG